jgi:hypothetical protein
LTLLSNGQLRLNRDLTSADAPATPTWTVTPTMTAPTTSTQCPATAPDAAQAAGYNAQLLCWDFTAAIPNTVGTGLSGTGACQGGLDCYLGCADNAGGQASDNMAHALYADYGIKYCNPTYNYNSAPAVRQVTDGTRGLALQIAWTPAAQQTAGQQWSIHTVAMSYDTPARLPALYNDFPFAAYVEETLRTNVESSGPAVPSQPGISGVGGGFLWTVTGPTSDVYNNHGVLEQDILEIVSKYTGVKSQPDSNFNNNCDIAGCIYKLEPVPTEGFFTDYPALPGGTSFSFAVPHKFAYLKTTDGVNASVCFFIDGVLFPTVEYPNDSYYPCVHYPPVPLPQTPPGPFTHTLGAGTVAERETMNIWNGSFGLTGPNRCPDSTNTYNSDCLTMPSEGAIITWLEGIRVYTCGGAMGHAVGSGPNPWCLAGTPGQLYTGPQGAKIFRVTQQ